MSNFFGERNLCFRSFEQIRSVQTRSEPRRLIVDRVRRVGQSTVRLEQKSAPMSFFFVTGRTIQESSDGRVFFEQTNVEDEYLCVYDFEQAQTGRIRSVLKRDDS